MGVGQFFWLTWRERVRRSLEIRKRTTRPVQQSVSGFASGVFFMHLEVLGQRCRRETVCRRLAICQARSHTLCACMRDRGDSQIWRRERRREPSLVVSISRGISFIEHRLCACQSQIRE